MATLRRQKFKRPKIAAKAKRLTFNPPQQRAGLLLFAAVFAVIGGVILWKRSSAANWSGYDDVNYPSTIYYLSGWTSKEQVNVENFSFEVWRMFTTGVIWTSLEYTVRAPADTKGWNKELALEVCIEAKLREGSSALITVHDIDRPNVPHASLKVKSGSFQKYCPATSELFIVSNVSDGQRKHIAVKAANWGPGAVDVRAIALKQIPVIHFK